MINDDVINDDVKELLEGPNFAALSTVLPDGMPSTQMMWVDTDGEHVLLNTEVHRQKFRNVQKHPEVAVAVIDAETPYHYAEIRGEVVDTITGDEARDHIDRLAKKYTGSDTYQNPIESERVILKVRPTRVRSMAAA